LNGQFEDYLVNDLVEYIDTNYNTLADRDKRCIMGRSIGAQAAMELTFKHPERLRGVASGSGRLDFQVLNYYIPYVLAEYGNTPPFNFTPLAGDLSHTLFTMAAAFTPNLANPPYFVDFLLNEQGVKLDSVWNKWLEHEPSGLAASLPKDLDLAIFFDIGKEDELVPYFSNEAFTDSLKKYDVKYKYQLYSGTHKTHKFTLSSINLDHGNG
jgi:enterochelin esterase-like enzyme